MADEWVPLVTAVRRWESPDDGRQMLEQISHGRYRMRWLDDQGVQRTGKLPEHLWRGHVNVAFGVLSFKGRTYQRIEILLPLEDVERETVDATIDAPDEVTIAPRAQIDWRRSGQSAVVDTVKALEMEYGPDAHPGEARILEKVKEHLPRASRQQVRDALDGSRLHGVPGHKSKV